MCEEKNKKKKFHQFVSITANGKSQRVKEWQLFHFALPVSYVHCRTSLSNIKF